LKFTSEGKFEFEVNAVQTNQAGIRIKDKKATLIKSNNLTKTYSAKAEGMMEVGPVVTVGLGLKTLLGSVNIVDVEGKAGFSIVGEASTSITAETDGHDVSYYKQANEKGEVHTCDACIKGEIFLYLNGDVGINSDLTDALGLGEMRIPFGNGKKHILGNWYYSISAEKGNKFDYGECPNYYKQLEFEEITKSDTDIFVGDEINLKARVPLHMEAAHPVSYKWIQSNKEYSHLVLSNQTSYDLNIPYAHVSDSGTYYCIAYYTELGEELLSAKSEPMHVAVNEGNIYFVENPSGNISIDKGGKFTLYAEAESNRGMKCQYLWYKNGQPISSGRYYSVDRATVYDGGSYYCVVTAVDDYGNSYERKISKTMKVEVWEGVTFPDLQPDEGVLMPFKYCKADGRVRTGYVYRYIKEDGDYITRVYY